MRIFELDNRFKQNVDQYADRIQNRVVDSSAMGKMWKHLTDTGSIPHMLGRQADNYLGLMSKCNPRIGKI